MGRKCASGSFPNFTIGDFSVERERERLLVVNTEDFLSFFPSPILAELGKAIFNFSGEDRRLK
jgi:hypothetical protein